MMDSPDLSPGSSPWNTNWVRQLKSGSPTQNSPNCSPCCLSPFFATHFTTLLCHYQGATHLSFAPWSPGASSITSIFGFRRTEPKKSNRSTWIANFGRSAAENATPIGGL